MRRIREKDMAKGDIRARSEEEFVIDIPPLWPQLLLNPENLYIRSQRAASWNQNSHIHSLVHNSISSTFRHKFFYQLQEKEDKEAMEIFQGKEFF